MESKAGFEHQSQTGHAAPFEMFGACYVLPHSLDIEKTLGTGLQTPSRLEVQSWLWLFKASFELRPLQCQQKLTNNNRQ